MNTLKFKIIYLVLWSSCLLLLGCSSDEATPEEIIVTFNEEFGIDPWTTSADVSGAQVTFMGIKPDQVETGFLYAEGVDTDPTYETAEIFISEEPLTPETIITLDDITADRQYSIRAYLKDKKTEEVYLGPVQNFKTLKEIEVFMMVNTPGGGAVSIGGTVTNRTGKDIESMKLIFVKIPAPGYMQVDIQLTPGSPNFEYSHTSLLQSGSNYYLSASVVVDGVTYIDSAMNLTTP